jgi:methionyl-tRNA formyltransferase
MGTPDFAARSLSALLEAPETGIEVPLVLSQPDKPVGRSRKLQAPPVKERALEAGVEVIQPRRLRSGSAPERIAELAPDVIVVVAYGRILPPRILELPRLGCLNVHASLLPELRGAAPINWAIARGHRQSGVSIMQMDEGLDTGAVLASRAVPIGPDDEAGDLHDRLMDLGAELLVPTLLAHARGELTAEPQDDARATWAPIMTRESGLLDWTRSAEELRDHARGMAPWPGSYSTWGDKTVKLFPPFEITEVPGLEAGESTAPGTLCAVEPGALVVACGSGAVRLRSLQLQGKRRISVADFLHGRKVTLGDRLGERP